MSEYIVILSTDDGGAMADIQKRYRVLSILPPRLLVVEIGESETQALRRLAGIQEVVAAPTEVIPASLNETEQLFVRAWQQRLQGPEKLRRGEGQDWDAEGFSPPDLPKGHPAD